MMAKDDDLLLRWSMLRSIAHIWSQKVLSLCRLLMGIDSVLM